MLEEIAKRNKEKVNQIKNATSLSQTPQNDQIDPIKEEPLNPLEKLI